MQYFLCFTHSRLLWEFFLHYLCIFKHNNALLHFLIQPDVSNRMSHSLLIGLHNKMSSKLPNHVEMLKFLWKVRLIGISCICICVATFSPGTNPRLFSSLH